MPSKLLDTRWLLNLNATTSPQLRHWLDRGHGERQIGTFKTIITTDTKYDNQQKMKYI